ncbi:hypothetical protein ACWEVD_29955 [Nocardia thailandica]|uniref:Uncharacterized protein n=1 Tax=Nocardia thailandica TaxID=257275 RepID=A0ABW6PHP0_9NOCA|nr:hypothetical protein [Nocardia thailandica]
MVTVYANQTVVSGEDLPEVIRAAEILGIGLKIENVLVGSEDEGFTPIWVVTREEEVPVYEEWDGRYEDAEDELVAVGE